jgi:hypothetical protein
MKSLAYQTFEHALQDATDLLNHFDALNKSPPAPPGAEVLKRASLVMGLAALETYVEDRIVEAADIIAGKGSDGHTLVNFYKSCLESDLKYFHTPNADRIKTIFIKYLSIDVTEGWVWNNYDSSRAKSELNKIAKKRGDIAHRSWRPIPGQPTPHAVTREELRKHIRFIMDLVESTESFLDGKL